MSQAVLDAVRDLLPQIRERAEEGERLRVVPDAFTLSMGETGQCKGPGQEVNTSNLYKLPFHSIFTSTITTPIIGMAYGAYAEHVEMQRKRVRAAYLGEKAVDDPF